LFSSINSPPKQERQNCTYLDTSPPYELNKAVGTAIDTSIDSMQHNESIDASITTTTSQISDIEMDEL